MADGISNISNTEQLVVCTRWMDDDLNSQEEFIELHLSEITNDDITAKMIKDILLHMNMAKVLRKMLVKFKNVTTLLQQTPSGSYRTIKLQSDLALSLEIYFRCSWTLVFYLLIRTKDGFHIPHVMPIPVDICWSSRRLQHVFSVTSFRLSFFCQNSQSMDVQQRKIKKPELQNRSRILNRKHCLSSAIHMPST